MQYIKPVFIPSNVKISRPKIDQLNFFALDIHKHITWFYVQMEDVSGVAVFDSLV